VVIGRQPQVAFDARAHFQRRGKGEQAIFRKAGTIV
jgi:hypothetical protein